ncbi:response regulator [Geobacter sp. FeAm09]|nr:response regulator [Geobacter sp. FeAm09]
MKSLFAEKPCLKCHAPQGYREGEVRGGLSVSVPLEPIYALMRVEMRGVYINHAVIWLLGLVGIGFGTRRLGRTTTELYEQTVTLEHEIEEREMAQETLQEQAMVLEEEIAERRQIEEAVRLSEEKFAKSFDNAPIIMTISTVEDGRFLDVNKKFVEISGFSRQEAVGSTSLELGWITPEQRQMLLTELRDKGRTSGVELHLRSKGEKYLTCIYYGELITVDGRHCLLSLAHDMTEQRTMEEQLRQAQKMEAIGQLAGGVAHDFNNVLTVIMGYCNLLQMDPKLDERQRDEVEQIVASSEKAAQLTRGLLTFGRKEVMDFRPANLNDIVQHVQKFLVRVIGEDIQLRTLCDGPAITVCVDSAQIEQVLINLATNARDAMQKGGLLSIETGIRDVGDAFLHAHGYGEPGRYACIAVSDSGCGMDEPTRKRIFEPFFTTKEEGRGTGLGMAIVYGIVKQHNGFINVYSEPGQGTTFRIYIPVSGQGPGPQQEAAEPAAPEVGTETILIAEDEVDVRGLMENILTRYGYQVILAEDGQEAVEKFTTNRGKIHLVLMDVIMPRKSGQEAVAEIRRLQPDMKVCYASGYTADFIRNRGVIDEGIELIMKPVQPLELLRKVREILDR